MLKSYAARFDSICIVDLVRCMFVDSQKSSIENIVQSYFKSMCNGTFNCIIMLCVQLLYFKIIFEFLLGIYFLKIYMYRHLYIYLFIYMWLRIQCSLQSILLCVQYTCIWAKQIISGVSYLSHGALCLVLMICLNANTCIKYW